MTGPRKNSRDSIGKLVEGAEGRLVLDETVGKGFFVEAYECKVSCQRRVTMQKAGRSRQTDGDGAEQDLFRPKNGTSSKESRDDSVDDDPVKA